MTGTINVGENWNGEPTIKNPEQFIEAVEEADFLTAGMTPDGDDVPILIENPNLNGDPKLLRAKVYRKGNAYKLIRFAEAWGLKVTDCWQHEVDKEEERVAFKLAPQERDLASEGEFE